MSHFSFFINACAMLMLLTGCNEYDSGRHNFRAIALTYPAALQDVTVADTLHGIAIADPYRWMENTSSQPTRDWLEQQRMLTENYLQQIPFRRSVRQRLQSYWNYERLTTPRRSGGFFYILKNEGLQAQDVLYRFQNSEKKDWAVVLDPTTTGAAHALSYAQDGSLLAYLVHDQFTGQPLVLLHDLESNRPLLDTIRLVAPEAGLAWFQDGFFYSRYPTPPVDKIPLAEATFPQVWYHRIGTPQTADALVFADRSQPHLRFQVQTTEDERFLILYATGTTLGNALYCKELSAAAPDFLPIVEDFAAQFRVIGNVGNNLLVLTNHEAPRYRLLQINTTRPEMRYWEEVIGPTDEVLQDVRLLGGKLVATYLRDASHRVRIFDLRGNLQQEIPLPTVGSVRDWQGSREDPQAFFTFTSFLAPPMILRLDLETYELSIFHQPQSPFPTEAFEVRQLRYKSYDGTEVLLSLIAKKGLNPDGTHPLLLYAHGGQGRAVLPDFNLTGYHLLPFILENGGICAIAHVRGGGEGGSDWHRAAAGRNKQKSFEDLQAAAEYLIANNYTRPELLALYGTTDGGLLAGVCAVQRPDLFRVVIAADGLFDMLRYQRFTTGWARTGEYGLSRQRQDFEAIGYYSPVHNVVSANYSSILLTVNPLQQEIAPIHSYKFAATLQAMQQQDLPILLRPTAPSNTAEKMDAAADVLSFLFYNWQRKVR
ncbi:MAG TPA: prolyl oligopeptidase family serine peptidase [Saprospiraceae bacterium]|nr:prolyl oligopeptidase family serine peptidase [Saprospiraceae bacterium]HMP22927.1 prolyl oligopeptidase family serine peptidase [Saprospiraceae bacterium]